MPENATKVLLALGLVLCLPAALIAQPPGGPPGGPPSIDADTLDGLDSTQFLRSDTSDTMTGTLTLSPGAGNALEVNADVNLANGNVLKGGTLFIHDNGTQNTALGLGALASNTVGPRNTAIGYGALYSNTTSPSSTAVGFNALRNGTGDPSYGLQSTAVGAYALYSNGPGYRNTAIGSQALRYNTTARNNTAVGTDALIFNTIGSYNTAVGSAALAENTVGEANTALGHNALIFNTTGYDNTAVGRAALEANTYGYRNTAIGAGALQSNTIGIRNIALGYSALKTNQINSQNTAVGYNALRDSTGPDNTAIGHYALRQNTTGGTNVAVGYRAGFNISTGGDNIMIANEGTAADTGIIRFGTPPLQSATYIAGIRGVTTGNMNAITVLIDSAGQLGTASSSRRDKEDILDMGGASSKLFELRPVTFRYKKASVSGEKPLRYGLIAEEVLEVFPELVAFDEEGQSETVLYRLLTPMLLNELQKQQRLNEEQNEQLARLRGRLVRLEALEAKRHPPREDRIGAR